MKKLFNILLAFSFATGVFSQVPEKMSYQAVVRNEAGQLVTNTLIGMQISILQGTSEGTVVYSEIQTPTTNDNGLVSIEIGTGTTSDDFSAIDWATGLYFIKTEIAVEAPLTTYTIKGTSQLLSVPYALHAKTVETATETDPVFTAWDKDYSDLTNKPDLSAYATIDMASKNIVNLADPVNEQDAVTKAYVDKLEGKVNELEMILIDAGLHSLKFKDPRDGNVYNLVKIGNQVWMAENLRYLPAVVGPGTGSGSMPYYYVCDYYGTVVADAKATGHYQTYGALYNWQAAMEACPEGWHLPTDGEWTELENYLIANGYNYDGTTSGNKIAKSLATSTGWLSSTNTGAVGNADYPEKRNATGFSALPDGIRGGGGTFASPGIYGQWWSATENNGSRAWYRYLAYNRINLYRIYRGKDLGFSVRCIRDVSDTAINKNPPVADFTATQTTIMAGHSVNFSDQSTNEPLSWLWDFGDGGTSTQQNPSYTYYTAGNYTVSLKVTNNYGSDSIERSNYITVIDTSTFNDPRDNSTYHTVTIGTQTWMVENLKYLPVVHCNSEFETRGINSLPGYGVYGCDTSDLATARAHANYKTYGVLYNWWAAMDGADSTSSDSGRVQGVCPDGWHLPGDDEWKELEMALGMQQEEVDSPNWRGIEIGSKMAGGYDLWLNGDLINNEEFGTSGFSALPGGNRSINGHFTNVNRLGLWWSTTEAPANSALRRVLAYNLSLVYRNRAPKAFGLSVRCIKD